MYLLSCKQEAAYLWVDNHKWQDRMISFVHGHKAISVWFIRVINIIGKIRMNSLTLLLGNCDNLKKVHNHCELQFSHL